MEDDVILRMRDSLIEDFRDMGVPEKDILTRVQNHIRVVLGSIREPDPSGDG